MELRINAEELELINHFLESADNEKYSDKAKEAYETLATKVGELHPADDIVCQLASTQRKLGEAQIAHEATLEKVDEAQIAYEAALEKVDKLYPAIGVASRIIDPKRNLAEAQKAYDDFANGVV